MHTQQKCISAHKFRIILEIWRNGNIITFKSQQVYKNNYSFKRAMNYLHDKDIVLIRQTHDGNEYKLSTFGKQVGMIFNELAK